MADKLATTFRMILSQRRLLICYVLSAAVVITVLWWVFSAEMSSYPSAAAFPISPAPFRAWQRVHDAPSSKLLCAGFYARLGNQMFQYASTLGLALASNRTPFFPSAPNLLRPVLKRFPPDPAIQPELAARCQKAAVRHEEACCKFDERLTELDPGLDYTIGTYLVSYRYFERHQSEIRRALVFSDVVRDQSSRVVRRLRREYNSSTLIGVHIRRGDMATERFRQLGYTVPTAAYVNRSMAYFRRSYPDCVFVVASNSMRWCRDNFPAGFRVHYLAPRASAVDMSIVAAMDHTIISFGTFSWWIGFFNAGTTVYMKDYIKMDTWLGKQFNPGGRDVVLPDWIPL